MGIGELDLVMTDGSTIIFVEVRGKHGQSWGSAAASIDGRKRRRLLAAARLYLARTSCIGREVRFDVVAVEGGRLSWLCNAIEGQGDGA
jgi:putative endonuclease